MGSVGCGDTGSRDSYSCPVLVGLWDAFSDWLTGAKYPSSSTGVGDIGDAAELSLFTGTIYPRCRQ